MGKVAIFTFNGDWSVTGVVAPAMATGAILSTVPDISGVSRPSITEEIHTTTLSIVADDIVKVGNLAFMGVQLVGRTVDAVVEGTMTLQALQDEIIHKVRANELEYFITANYRPGSAY